MPKPGAERSRDRVLTDDEIRIVWAACAMERPAMCTLLRLRLLTAQRGGELAALRWTDLDLQPSDDGTDPPAVGDWLTIPATVTKNKRQHRVYLTTRAKDLLNALPRIDGCDYLFPGRSGNRPLGDAKKAGQRVAARILATLQKDAPTVETFDFRGHDLRCHRSDEDGGSGDPASRYREGVESCGRRTAGHTGVQPLSVPTKRSRSRSRRGRVSSPES